VPRLAATALAVALAVLAAGCGDSDGGEAVSGPAGAIPVDTVAYVEADISGEGEQHENLDALLSELGEVPLLGTPVEPTDVIAQALEDLGADNGVDISYEEDFEPWLGNSMALGYSSVDEPDPAFVMSIAADDEQLARDALERIVSADSGEETRAEYDGVTYFVSPSSDYAVGAFDDMLVLSTRDEFEAAVDAARGDSLADEDAVAEAFGALPEERLASVYVDVEAIAESEADTEAARERLEAIRDAVPELLEPLAAGLVAGERTLALDVAVPHGEDAPEFAGTEKLAEAPSDAFAALGFADFGAQVAAIVDRIEPHMDEGALGEDFERTFDVPLVEALAGIGDSVAYARGELPDAFAATLEASMAGESDVVERVLAAAQAAAERDDDTVVGPALGGGTGFSAEPTPDVADTSPVKFINAELGDELQVMAATDREVAEQPVPADTLGDTERFQAASEALSEDFEMVGFADLEQILDAVVPGGSILDLAVGQVPPEQAAAGFLADKLGFAAAGVRTDGDYSVQRLVVGLR
jgi:Protein of unknown function (DUF3352)